MELPYLASASTIAPCAVGRFPRPTRPPRPSPRVFSFTQDAATTILRAATGKTGAEGYATAGNGTQGNGTQGNGTTAPATASPAAGEGQPAYLVQSADHALRLLRAVAQRGSIRVAEAAQLLEVVPSTAHRLLATLSHQGFVVQERRGGAYLPGPTIAEVAGGTRAGIDLRAAARTTLEWLREQTGETASLMVLEGPQVRFLDSIDGSRSVRVSARTGVILPAHCTSGGKALLASLHQERLVELYPDEQLVGRSPRSITRRTRLEAELRDVRRRGFATNLDEGDAGIGAVSVVVRSLGGDGAVAALCLAAPIDRLRTKKAAAALVPVLRSGRDQLEVALSGHPPPAPPGSAATGAPGR